MVADKNMMEIMETEMKLHFSNETFIIIQLTKDMKLSLQIVIRLAHHQVPNKCFISNELLHTVTVSVKIHSIDSYIAKLISKKFI